MMIINIVKDEKYLKQVLVSILVTYVAVAVYAYVLVAQGVPRIYAPFDVDVAAKSGESAALGGYLLIIMSILLGLFCYAPTFRFSAIMMGLFVFALIPFIYTLSRASFFAFVPMCGAILLFTKRRRPVLAIALVAGLVFSPLIFPKAVKDVTSRITETFQGSDMESRSVAGVQIKETSALLRVQSWNKALTSWAATQPFFGYGVTGVGMVDTQYPLTIGELGLIGFGIFIWLLVSVLINAVRIYNSINHWLARGLSLGLVAATLALMTQAVAVNTFITIRIAEPFWMLVGLVIALPEIFPGETRAEDYALKGESPL
ncbi:MAG: hypothetical protein A2297_01135 [Elusimicrobia bacterium RIFOXYB2_FULL_48_7]|nr:MAG: hypothetical protein A2297_01135 [Elusimicrobia bacterium RIFOXYB2_FULL_48_7]